MGKGICAFILLVFLSWPAAGRDLAVGIKVGLSNPCFSGDDCQNRLIFSEQDYTATGELAEEQFAPLFLNLVCSDVNFYFYGGTLFSLEGRFSMGLESWKQNNIQILAGFGRLITGRKNLRSRLR